MNRLFLAATVLLAGLVLVFFTLRNDGPANGVAAGPAAAAAPAPATPERPTPAISLAGERDAPDPVGLTSAAGQTRDVAVLAEADAQSPPRPAKVFGRIVDSAGLAVAAAEVELEQEEVSESVWADWLSEFEGDAELKANLTTDDEGKFTARMLVGTGLVRVQVEAAGFVAFSETLVPERGPDGFDLGEVQLTRAVLVAGRVVDPSGRSVPEARIHLIEPMEAGQLFFSAADDRGELLATSDAGGQFAIETLPPGPLHLLVLHPDHPDQEFVGACGPDGDAGLVIRLESGGEISGVVRSALAGSVDLTEISVRATPASGVSLDTIAGPRPWRQAACAADGSFRVAGLNAAEAGYTLRAMSGRGALFDTDWRSSPVEAAPGERGVTLQLSTTLSVAFTPVDATTGERIDSWELQIVHAEGGAWETEEVSHDDEDRVRSDPDTGRVTVRDVRPPSASSATSLLLSAGRYQSQSTGPVTLSGLDSYDYGELALTPYPTLRVLVSDASTGDPVEGAEVSLSVDGEHQDFTADANGNILPGVRDYFDDETDAEGMAELPRIVGLPLRIGVWVQGYANPEDIETVLTAAGTGTGPDFTFELYRGGQVTVLVLDPRGHPAAGQKVSATTLGFEESEATDAEGRARFRNLKPQLYSFEVQGLAESSFDFGPDDDEVVHGPEYGEVKVTEGLEHELTLERPAIAFIEGRITEGDTPLRGAVVHATKEGDFYIPGFSKRPEARTGADGRYRLGPMDGGTQVIEVEHPDRLMSFRTIFLAREGDHPLDVDLPVTTVTGRVTAPDGAPVANAVVEVRDLNAGSTSTIAIQVATSGGANLNFSSASNPSAQTDANGDYELRGLRSETKLRVTASHDDFQSADSEPFELSGNDTRNGVDLVLRAASKLLVTVPGAGEDEVRIQLVRLDPEAGEGEPQSETIEVQEETDAEGRVLITGLEPGPWKVIAIGLESGRVNNDHQVTLVAGETTPLTVPLP